MQNNGIPQSAVDDAITTLQRAGWLQDHDREIMSVYACIARLTDCGWLAQHDAETRCVTEARIRLGITAPRPLDTLPTNRGYSPRREKNA